jgi:deoxyribodipyrimidine photo-lyase
LFLFVIIFLTPSKSMTKLVWFRSDLRTIDHPALYHAVQQALSQQPPAPVVAAYIVSPSEWKAHSVAPCKVEFILRNLRWLSQHLWKEYRIPLVVQTASTKEQVHEQLAALMDRFQVTGLYFNAEYEVNESRRDKRVKERFQDKTHMFDDQCVVLPGLLRSKNGEGNVYTVYTPFKKSWYRYVFEHGAECLRVFDLKELLKKHQKSTANPSTYDAVKPDAIPYEVAGYDLKGFSDSYRKTLHQLWPEGEDAAQKRLEEFATSRALSDYDDQRNFVANEKGTSGLSTYLASGIISSKVCVKKALSLNGGKMDIGNKGNTEF